MKKRNLISTILLGISLSTGIVFTSTAQAHDRNDGKHITVIKTFKDSGHDRWYIKRHREARGHWGPQRKRHHRHHRKQHRHYHKHNRVERRHHRKHHRAERRYYDAQPRRTYYHDDGIQLHIDYELRL